MCRLSTMAFVGMLCLTTVGCGGQGNGVSNVPKPSATPVVEKQTTVKQVTSVATVTQQPASTTPSSGLIQPTNPQERAKQVAKGRKDPFAVLPGQLVATPTVATTLKSVPRLPNPPVAVVSPSKIAAGPINPIAANRLPPAPPVLPPALQPDLAKGVTVTGVVQVGNETQAIIKVPNETTSRYVRAGQWLSNGQVQVKRIDMNGGSDPVVTLEQYGVEVNKAVGAGTQTGKTTAGTPTPTPANPRSSED